MNSAGIQIKILFSLLSSSSEAVCFFYLAATKTVIKWILCIWWTNWDNMLEGLFSYCFHMFACVKMCFMIARVCLCISSESLFKMLEHEEVIYIHCYWWRWCKGKPRALEKTSPQVPLFRNSRPSCENPENRRAWILLRLFCSLNWFVVGVVA